LINKHNSPASLLWIVAAAALLTLADRHAVAQAAQPSSAEPENTNSQSGIVMKYADIHGQVFIASEKRGRKETPAAGVTVQIQDVQSNYVLRTTNTDEQGRYDFARIDPGEYKLVIGALRLKLKVIPEPLNTQELPKIIIAVLPKEMAHYKVERPADDR